MLGIDKSLILVLFPFFTLVLLVGFVLIHSRGGRPIRLTLKGLGIEFTLSDFKGDQSPQVAEKGE